MAEYVDREKIFPNGVFIVNANDPMKSLDELISRIVDLPAADVVEVVRCKNCEKYNIKDCASGFGWCEFRDCGVMENHYCSFAERKGGTE